MKEDITDNPRFLGFWLRSDDGDEYLGWKGWTDNKKRARLFKTREEARVEQKETGARRVPVLRPATIEDIETLDGDEYRKMSDRQKAKLHRLMNEMNLAEFFVYAADFFDQQSDKLLKRSNERKDRDFRRFDMAASTRCATISNLLKPMAELLDVGDEG